MKNALRSVAPLLAGAGVLLANADGFASSNAPAEVHPIDLPTTLRLLLSQNHQVRLAEERVKEAQARWRLAQYQMVPTLRFGANYYYQDGTVQNSSGAIQDITRSGAYAGLGAGAVGSGLAARPGISIEADLARAIYEPLAARQAKVAAEAGSESVRQRQSLVAVTAFYDLLRTKSRLAVVEDAVRMHTELTGLTDAFAGSGAGLQSDAERAGVEKSLAESRLAGAHQQLALASVELARLLRLDPGIRLVPEGELIPVEFPPDPQPASALVAQALKSRAELRAGEALVAEAEQRARQAGYGPLLPKVALGASIGGFGGAPSATPGSFDDRTDFGGAIYWELDGLGLGSRQRHRERRAQLEAARIQQDDWQQRVRAEVAAALARLSAAKEQVELTRTATERAARAYEFNHSLAFERKAPPIGTLQSIQALTNARQQHLDALAEHNTAQFALYTAIGQPPKLRAQADSPTP